MKCGIYLTPTGNIYEVVGDSRWGGKTLKYRKGEWYSTVYCTETSLKVLLDGCEYLGKL